MKSKEDFVHLCFFSVGQRVEIYPVYCLNV